ncbi:MAG TPA: polyprenyl synthetase family protein [Candidatus Polarisedimenticolia bacterium]|jgi:octaprenyl-diphosphate synthase|nr:polyprenyl synthetase family protein [Candidatus Polarisedimenticolia bacterium]
MSDLASGARAPVPHPSAAGAGLQGAAPRYPPGLPEIIALVGDKLRQVEEECRRNLRSEVGAIDELGRYLADTGGKRVRPILLLLAAQMCGYRGDRDVLFASVFEFIHTATLVHDDVIDGAETRRGRGTMNARWGNGLTVLLGDYLYIKSMNMALEADDIRIIRILAQITLKMIEGEIVSDRQRGQMEMTEADHLEVIRRKTAYLFSGCGRVAGVLSGLDTERLEALAAYGMHLGMAFQIVDDLLDVTAESRVLGKPAASDLKEGKLTLPFIYLLERASKAERDMVRTVLEEGDFRTVSREEVLVLLRHHRTLDRTRELAVAYASQARHALEVFAPSPAREALKALPQFVVSRQY